MTRKPSADLALDIATPSCPVLKMSLQSISTLKCIFSPFKFILTGWLQHAGKLLQQVIHLHFSLNPYASNLCVFFFFFFWPFVLSIT